MKEESKAPMNDHDGTQRVGHHLSIHAGGATRAAQLCIKVKDVQW
jgi:hypothetical protein